MGFYTYIALGGFLGAVVCFLCAGIGFLLIGLCGLVGGVLGGGVLGGGLGGLLGGLLGSGLLVSGLLDGGPRDCC